MILTSMLVYSNEPIEININAKNDLNQKMNYSFSFGIAPNATNNNDASLGELLLPPAPPSGFYTAFEYIDSSTIDPDGSIYYDKIWTNKDMKHYPANTQFHYVKHKMIFKFGNGKKILLNWNKSTISDKIDSIWIKDGFDGLVLKADMKKVENLEWDNNGIQEIYIHVYYNLGTTSVNEDIATKPIFVYPNPAQDILKIDYSDQINKVEIFDIIGSLAASCNDMNYIDISKLQSGSYIVRIYSNDKIYEEKIIKKQGFWKI